MTIRALTLAALLAIACSCSPIPAPAQVAPGPAVSPHDLPDAHLTPGAVNLDVTQDNIHQTICVSGWTKTIRPPASYTTKLKIEQMKAMGLNGSTKDFEEDHLISLEIGGNPTSPLNLWPEHWADPWGAHKKDAIETKLKRLVCGGAITLAEAQHDIATDWIAAYRKYIGTETASQ